MAEKSKQQNKRHAWLIGLIWVLVGITVEGLLLGGFLLYRIYEMSGWRPGALTEALPQQTPDDTQRRLEPYLSNVLVTVQNEPMITEHAPANMAFIVSFNALTQELTVVALPDELLVETEQGRLTVGEAYAAGGAVLLLQAVNQNFGLPLQYYAATDTYSMAAMIDLLGGVSADITRDEADYINRALHKQAAVQAGQNLLTGTQCMVHAMDDLSGGMPFGGNRRALVLIDSAVASMRDTATKEAMLPLLSLVMSSIKTNLDIETLRGFAYEILKADDMQTNGYLAPLDGSWRYVGSGEARKIRADIEENAAWINGLLYSLPE